jgi:hypothetical protein
MRPSTVLAAVSTLLLTVPTAKAQDTCATGFNAAVGILNPVKEAPFTATVKATFDQKLADGNSIHGVVHYQMARDASGRTVSQSPLNCYLGDDGRAHQAFQFTVNDRSTNTMENWMVSDNNAKVANIMHPPQAVRPSEAELAAMRANAKSRPRPAQANPWQIESLGIREFHGVAANGTRRTLTIPAGQEGNALAVVTVNESWTSPKLGISMMEIRDDPRRGRTVAEVEEFHEGDPDPSLFSPPRTTSSKNNPPRHPQPSSAPPPHPNNGTRLSHCHPKVPNPHCAFTRV